MKDESKKVFIGIVTYNKNTAKYLLFFLESLKKQTYNDFELLVADNSDEGDDNIELIKRHYPAARIFNNQGNIGFARAYNKLIDQARTAGAEYFLSLNIDTILADNFIEKILINIADDKVAAVAPKILYWDFENKKKTNIIDSTGLFITKEHRFSDLNQGEVDNGQFDEQKQVFGFTGAAVLLKMKALEEVAYKNYTGKNEYFDDLMFMYKEDCDLSYRLRLADWDIIYAPEARVYHHRFASPKGESNFKIALNRKNKSKQVKKWSFLNHWILILKYKNLPYPLRIKIATRWYQFKSFVFVLLFEQYLLLELKKLWQWRKRIESRRAALKIKVNLEKIINLII